MGGLLELAFFIGAVILLIALIWGAASYRRRNRANEPVTEQATRALYADTDAYGDKEAQLRNKTSP